MVNQQPPQVVRKDARFTANVRLLVGHKLNVFMSMPTVEASIIRLVFIMGGCKRFDLI